MKIIKENIHFERGSSGRGIKDKLFGFRPGELLTYSKEIAARRTSKPYIEVYMYTGPSKEFVQNRSGF